MNRDIHLHFYSQGATSAATDNASPPLDKVVAKPKTYVGKNMFPDGPLESILYSKNGTSWSNIKEGGFKDKLNDFAYGSNCWVAVGSDGSDGNYGFNSTIQYSGNGSNWSNSVSGGFGVGFEISVSGNAVSYNPTKKMWVAVGVGYSSTNSILYSGNGSNWSNAHSGGFDNGEDGYYGKDITNNGSNLWVAVGPGNYNSNISIYDSTTTLQYSGDGSNWSNSVASGFGDELSSGVGRAISYNSTKRMWVAVGTGSSQENSILYSGNGSNWSNAYSGGFDSGNYSIYAGERITNNGSNLWVATGIGESPSTCIQYSGDGSNWSNSLYTGVHIAGELSWTGSKFLIKYTNSVLKSSTNGITWTSALPLTPSQVAHT